MSGVVKGVKKVFKKVVKVVKKVAVPLVAAGAIFFTGGAALGLTGLAGGWSAAASAVGSALGGSGIIGSALSGAIYQAGIGAAAGGAISAVTGGSFSKGAKAGAKIGAITGGAMGGYQGITGGKGLFTAAKGGGKVANTPAAASTPSKSASMSGAGMPGTPAGGIPGGTTPSTAAPIAGKKGGLFSGIADWAKKNPTLAGGIVQGAGQAIGDIYAAKDDRKLVAERYNQVRQNYSGADPGANYTPTPDPTPQPAAAAPTGERMSPGQRFSGNYYSSFEYQYDPQQGRVVRVPVGG